MLTNAERHKNQKSSFIAQVSLNRGTVRSKERAGPGVCEGDGQAECVSLGGTEGFPTLDMLRINSYLQSLQLSNYLFISVNS